MATTKHPSQMDKRTKIYKDWAAAEEAKKAAAGKPEPIEATDGPRDQPMARVVDGQIHTAATSTSPAVTDIVDLEVKERKAPTRPWEKKNGHRPWRRDYFNLQRKHAGFRPRFVDPAKVESRIQRGYVVADPEHYGGLVDIDIRESKGMGKYISRHGMILMEIPEEGARAYEEQNEERIKAQYRKMKKEVRDEKDQVVEGISITATGME